DDPAPARQDCQPVLDGGASPGPELHALRGGQDGCHQPDPVGGHRAGPLQHQRERGLPRLRPHPHGRRHRAGVREVLRDQQGAAHRAADPGRAVQATPAARGHRRGHRVPGLGRRARDHRRDAERERGHVHQHVAARGAGRCGRAGAPGGSGAVASAESPGRVSIGVSAPAASLPARRLRLGRLYPYLLVAPTLLFLLAVFLYPVLYSLYLSSRHMQLFEFGTGGKIARPADYLAAARDPLVWNAVMRTGGFVVGAVALELTLGLTIALFLNQRLPGRRFLRAIALFPLMLTPVVLGITFRILFNYSYGIINYALD